MKTDFEYAGKRIHFVGIGGVSMRTLAKLSARLNATVSGSDDHAIPDISVTETAEVYVGQRPEAVRQADLVVFSSAIPCDHEELIEARNHNIPTMERSEYLSLIASLYPRCVAISGCHGKTTATTYLAEILHGSDIRAVCHIGGTPIKDLWEAYYPQGEVFVTEACEYNRSFLHLSPDIAVVLNVDYDHPDTYANIDETRAAFSEFAHSARHALICPLSETELINNSICRDVYAVETRNLSTGDIPTLRCFYENIRRRGVNVVSYVFTEDSGGVSVQLYVNGNICACVRLPLCSDTDVQDAVFAVIAAMCLGVDKDSIAATCPTLLGAKGRMQKICTSPMVYRDYAHHPTEIRAAISKIQRLYPDKELIVAFEPHTYSRTRALLRDFADSLKTPSRVWILPTFAAREDPSCGADAHTLYLTIQHPDKEYLTDYASLTEHIDKWADEHTIILLLGAGDISKYDYSTYKKTVADR